MPLNSRIAAFLLNRTVKIRGDIDSLDAPAVMVIVMGNEIVERGLRYPNRQLELFENFHSVAADMYISLEFPEVSVPGVPCKTIRARHSAARTQGSPHWEFREELPEVAIERQNMRVE